MSYRPIDKILIANRGEIAVRIMRTCRDLGIATVAVYSDADAGAPHVAFADEAVRIGPPPARESYLSIDALLDAARAAGADAIHPGYGFLSENAGFAMAVGDAGLTWIGPNAMVIALLGSKKDAKHTASRAGVPVVPGYAGADQDAATLIAAGRELGYPILVKASAGGGGKGMRIARDDGELAGAIDRAKSEAGRSFGDDTLILERYIERPRHVEVQILGDHHGNLIHLWERECSVQRRHQKVIEESPSPALDQARRSSIAAAGVAVGKAVGYTSAGTVEMIVAPDGAFYFLEVNTRLQVEHAVTEMTTGVDLVREQIRIARGEHLTWDAPPPPNGHAIEARLYAEDADGGYLPTTGRLVDVAWPSAPGLRIDAGVVGGDEIGIHYDPMLAKLIAHAPTRRDAIQLLAWALDRTWLPGTITNREHLARVLRHSGFGSGEIDTHFLDRHAGELVATPPTADEILAAVTVAVIAATAARRENAALPTVPPGWRNVPFADQRATYRTGDHAISVGYREIGSDRVRIAIGERVAVVRRIAVAAGAVTVEDEAGVRRRHRVARDGDRTWVDVGGRTIALALEPRFPEATAAIVAGGLVAPMPGKVVKIVAVVGVAIAAGDALLVLEAMKMEHVVRAADAGTLAALHVAEGDQVEADQLLAVVS
jgi:acetyl/propionyl-CoA carboxylase alpha subunit